jgi:hypothetical protein
MAQTAIGPQRGKIIGETALFFSGVAGGSGTTTTVTLPGNITITHVVVSGATSATAVYCDTVSANTFTATHASSDLFAYIAFVKPKGA